MLREKKAVLPPVRFTGGFTAVRFTGGKNGGINGGSVYRRLNRRSLCYLSTSGRLLVETLF